MQLMRTLYKEAICNLECMKKVEKVVSREVEQLAAAQKDNMTQTEYEEFRGMLFDVSAVAQEEAFLAGMRYGMTMLHQNLEETQD